jgi:FkbM family methyltransferase
MTDRQLAALWWRQLFSELGIAADTGAPGPLGYLAKDRHRAVEELFFTLLLELPVDCLVEVGAHDADASKRFVGAKQNARAVAFEAAPEVYERVVSRGLPERLTMLNCAIGAKAGSVKFFVPRDRHLHVWASTLRRAGNVDVQEFVVPMISLDDAGRSIASTGEDRDLGVWIDVEGSALDVLRSGESLLKQRVSIAYVEVNDVSVYEGAATSLDIISLFLTHGFIPVARDNQYGDAWNLLVVHEDAHYAARETITKWFYRFSESTALASRLANIEPSALKFQTIFDAASSRPLWFNEKGIPGLLETPDRQARVVMISACFGGKGALVSLPGEKVCRADETGTLVADRQHVMGHEIFELLPADGGEFHMKSHWDKFVRLGSDSTFDATAERAKAAARFTVKDLDPNPAEIQKLLRLGTLGNLIG